MKRLLPLLLLLANAFLLSAQDDLLNMLEQEAEKPRDFAIATFKGNRIINSQSVEQPGEGELQFIIAHRFGRMSGGGKEFFGLDNATIRIGAEYGILDNLSIGIGRSSFQKVWDGYFKWRILRQQKGLWNFPLSVSLFSSIAIRSDDWEYPERKNYFTSRMSYSYQLLIARKFGQWFSLQLMPTMIHRNLVTLSKDRNDVFALGAGASLRLSRNVRLLGEYFYVFPNQIYSPVNGEKVRNCFSIGLDIETGGHVFQLHFTNSRGMIEKSFVAETTGNWFPKDFKDFGVQFGFNITRAFTIYKPKKIRNLTVLKKKKKN